MSGDFEFTIVQVADRVVMQFEMHMTPQEAREIAGALEAMAQRVEMSNTAGLA